jgi:hypothetical protein
MKTLEYENWDSIVKKYPDSFVLLENPVSEHGTLKKGIFRYKNKTRKKVFEKAKELALHSITIRYTEGMREERLKNTAFIL